MLQEHARSALTTRYGHWRTVIDADLEASWAPLDKIERGFGLQRSDCSITVSWNNIASVEQCHGHILSLCRVAYHHLVGCLCTLASKLVHLEALMRRLLLSDDRREADQWVVDSWVWDKVGLELVEVDIQRAVKTQTGGDRGHYLGDKAVEVLKIGTRDIQITPADFVDSFVVDQEGTIGVLNGAVGRKDCIVRFNHCSGSLRSRIDGEFQLRLLPKVCRQSLQQKRAKTRASSSPK